MCVLFSEGSIYELRSGTGVTVAFRNKGDAAEPFEKPGSYE